MKRVFIITLALLAVFFSTVAQADTVTLTLTAVSNNNGSVYTYPYMFSINGSSTLVALMCDDYKDDVQPNETWVASVNSVAQAGTNDFMGVGVSDSVNTYNTAAYLFAQAAASGNNADYTKYNEAVWQLMGGPDFGLSDLIAAAKKGAADQNASYFNQFVFYTYQSTPGYPTGPNSSYHTPTQEYIGFVPAPEPGSFALLGTGLAGLAGIVRRRMRK